MRYCQSYNCVQQKNVNARKSQESSLKWAAAQGQIFLLHNDYWNAYFYSSPRNFVKKTPKLKCAIWVNHSCTDKNNHYAQWIWQKIFNLLWNLLSFKEIHVIYSLAIELFHLFINSFRQYLHKFQEISETGKICTINKRHIRKVLPSKANLDREKIILRLCFSVVRCWDTHRIIPVNN